MKSKFLALSVSFVMATCGMALAQQPVMEEMPETQIMFRPTPIVLGEVVNMNSHSITCQTARGEQMVFEFDSRTLMPMSMPRGTRVKVEFHLMDNGMHHAGRITRIEPNSLAWRQLDEQLAYYDEHREELLAEADAEAGLAEPDVALASDAELEGETQALAERDKMAGAHEVHEGQADVAMGAEGTTTDTDATQDESAHHELPQTSSVQPLMLVLGAAATSFALGMLTRKRRRD